jgi:hypothetical protein
VFSLFGSYKTSWHAASSLLFLQGNIISTPELEGTILPGITRQCVIELARSLGYKVSVNLLAKKVIFAMYKTGFDPHPTSQKRKNQ